MTPVNKDAACLGVRSGTDTIRVSVDAGVRFEACVDAQYRCISQLHLLVHINSRISAFNRELLATHEQVLFCLDLCRALNTKLPSTAQF